MVAEADTAVNQVADLVSETARACKEQQTGIVQVNKAMAQMNSVTQAAAANSEETAAASEELSAQSEAQAAIVHELGGIIGRQAQDQPLQGPAYSPSGGKNVLALPAGVVEGSKPVPQPRPVKAI